MTSPNEPACAPDHDRGHSSRHQIAESIRAKLIVIATRSGNTAWVKSQSRSRIPTLGASESLETLRRMNLFWGIKPIHAEHLDDTSAFIDEICRWGRSNAHLQSGDHIVFVTGTGVVEKAHNLVIVHTVAVNDQVIRGRRRSPM